jgi:exodeoxyribonuclease VII large subunit
MSGSVLTEAVAETAALSVTQLNAAVKRTIDHSFGPLWVRGEIASLKVYQSGHWYFTLCDDQSQVRCCMWRSHASKAGKPPADGTQVFALATPGIWEEKGEFRLTVTKMLGTDVVGDQQRELERVRKALERDGLFALSRKRSLPPYPLRIAVVTSLDGAALRDIITVSRKRWPAATLLVLGTRVQGDGAPDELCRALERVNRLEEIDLCIMGRGGGARDDLAAFNNESVCRALAAVKVPTVSAVGHETDVSLCDLVADIRAATPSAAAELALPDRDDVLRRFDAIGARLAGVLGRRAQVASERLGRTADRLEVAMEQVVRRPAVRLDRVAAQLDALSPLKVLGRGYAVPMGRDGHVLKRRADFAPGETFKLRVVDGDVLARPE